MKTQLRLGRRLLLATGSNPFILPIPGKDLPGVLAYRDIADTQAMIDASQKYRRAVVIGGGLLGLVGCGDDDERAASSSSMLTSAATVTTTCGRSTGTSGS